MNDDLNLLGYNSSQPDMTGLDEVNSVKAEDVEDFTALQQVSLLLRNRKKYYLSLDSVDLSKPESTWKKQIIDNKRMIFHINELESLIDSTVLKIKEQING